MFRKLQFPLFTSITLLKQKVLPSTFLVLQFLSNKGLVLLLGRTNQCLEGHHRNIQVQNHNRNILILLVPNIPITQFVMTSRLSIETFLLLSSGFDYWWKCIWVQIQCLTSYADSIILCEPIFKAFTSLRFTHLARSLIM